MLNVALFLSLFFLNSLFVDGLSCLSLILKYPIVSHVVVVVVFDWSKILSLLFEKALSVDTCLLASSSKEFCVYKWSALSYRIRMSSAFIACQFQAIFSSVFIFVFVYFFIGEKTGGKRICNIFKTVYMYMNDIIGPTQELSCYVLHFLFLFLYLPAIKNGVERRV